MAKVDASLPQMYFAMQRSHGAGAGGYEFAVGRGAGSFLPAGAPGVYLAAV